MRSRIFSPAIFTLAAAFGIAATPRIVSAVWPVSGRAVCDDPAAQQHPAITGDGAGGAIVVWEDARTPPSLIAAQHVLATGEVDPAWPHFGRVLMAVPIASRAGGQAGAVLVSDGEGGAIAVWLDNRDDVTGTDIYAQHVLASGFVDQAWPATGLAVCIAQGVQNTLTVATDGAGGAIATWVDSRVAAGEFDIFAQRILVSGVVDPAWPANGAAVCTEAGPQGFPVVVEDGLEGAIVSWHDLRPAADGFDVYAQHVLASGVMDAAWPVNGRAVCSASGDQGRPTIASDGVHGAIVAWTDSRAAGTSHIFVQHVQVSGAIDPAWPVNGVAVSNAGVLESRPLAVPDDDGGVLITWQAFSAHLNMYAQHVTGAGAIDPAWPAGGKALSHRERRQTAADIARDGNGGAVIAWQDSFDIVAMHVLANGATDPTYSDSARVLCGLPGQQGDPAIAAAGPGGAIVVWTDGRSATNADIFALQVLAATPAGVSPAPPAIAFAAPFPNPANGSMALRFVLERDAHVSLTIYDVAGHRVRALVAGARQRGENRTVWDALDDRGQRVRAGVYFARLEVDHRSMTRKLIQLR